MLTPEPHHSRYDRYIQNCLETGVSKIIGIGREVRGLRKDNTIFPIYLATSRVELEKEILFAGITIDINEQKRAEQGIKQAKEIAIKDANIKSDFLARMSHATITPINAALGMTKLLRDTLLDQKKQTKE